MAPQQLWREPVFGGSAMATGPPRCFSGRKQSRSLRTGISLSRTATTSAFAESSERRCRPSPVMELPAIVTATIRCTLSCTVWRGSPSCPMDRWYTSPTEAEARTCHSIASGKLRSTGDVKLAAATYARSQNAPCPGVHGPRIAKDAHPGPVFTGAVVHLAASRTWHAEGRDNTTRIGTAEQAGLGAGSRDIV